MTHSYRINPDRPLLTPAGCESLCNDGFQLWAAQDTLLRFVLWLLPVIVVIAHFHFPPLASSNVIAVIVHLLGDPIDSLWSMMTRQEAFRRLFRRAKISGLPNEKSVTTVWGAYEEIGWQDPSENMLNVLDARKQRQKLVNGTTQPLIDKKELYAIELAAHRITCNRSESQLATTVAIMGLVVTLVGPYLRTWSQRLNNQTSHTIAMVSLLFIDIPVVRISGDIGAFTSSTAVVEIIQELRRNLSRHTKGSSFQGCAELFLPLRFRPDGHWDYNSAIAQRAGCRYEKGVQGV